MPQAFLQTRSSLVNGVRVPGIAIHGPAKPEVQSIEVGINRVFAAFAPNQILVLDDLHGFLDELQSYSRELDEMGEPTEKIEAKETFHLLDAVPWNVRPWPSFPLTAGGSLATHSLIDAEPLRVAAQVLGECVTVPGRAVRVEEDVLLPVAAVVVPQRSQEVGRRHVEADESRLAGFLLCLVLVEAQMRPAVGVVEHDFGPNEIAHFLRADPDAPKNEQRPTQRLAEFSMPLPSVVTVQHFS